MISRDATYAALATRLAAFLPGYQITRNYVDWDSPKIAQPTCIVISRAQQPIEDPQRPPRWHLQASVILYMRNEDPSVVTDTLVNAALDNVTSALRMQPSEAGGTLSSHTTLGGLVQHAWIDGQIEIFQGLEGDQVVVLVPVSMLAV